jgi:hypothetical protein
MLNDYTVGRELRENIISVGTVIDSASDKEGEWPRDALRLVRT